MLRRGHPVLSDEVEQLAVEPDRPRRTAPSHSRTALRTMASNTGWTSVGELEMTRRISPVAVCCSSDSVSSRFRASSSWNSRTFSIAITAWSAKVWSSSICLSREGRHLASSDVIAPIGLPSRSMGTARAVRNPARYRAGSARTPGPRRCRRARPTRQDRPGPSAASPRWARVTHADWRRSASASRHAGDQVDQAPVEPKDRAVGGLAQRHGTLRRWRRTPAGRRSASCEMTRRISPVAVCCSSASVSSRFRASSSWNSRTFSIAITAWSAKVWSSSICLAGEGPAVVRRTRDGADRHALAQHAAPTGRCATPDPYRLAALVLRVLGRRRRARSPASGSSGPTMLPARSGADTSRWRQRPSDSSGPCSSSQVDQLSVEPHRSSR